MAETATSIYDRLTAVRDAPLDSAAKLMLFVLVSYANNNGDAWPSNERLTSDLQLSERQVRRLLTELRHAAIVSAWMEGKTRKLRIDFDRLRALPSTASPMGDTHVPPCSTKGDTHVRQWGTPTSPRTYQGTFQFFEERAHDSEGGHQCPP